MYGSMPIISTIAMLALTECVRCGRFSIGVLSVKDIIIGKNSYNKALSASALLAKIQNSKFRIQNCFSEFREISADAKSSKIP